MDAQRAGDDVLPTESTGRWRYWRARYREERSVRLLVGLSLVAAALALGYLGGSKFVIGLFAAPGGWIVRSGMWKR